MNFFVRKKQGISRVNQSTLDNIITNEIEIVNQLNQSIKGRVEEIEIHNTIITDLINQTILIMECTEEIMNTGKLGKKRKEKLNETIDGLCVAQSCLINGFLDADFEKLEREEILQFTNIPNTKVRMSVYKTFACQFKNVLKALKISNTNISINSKEIIKCNEKIEEIIKFIKECSEIKESSLFF